MKIMEAIDRNPTLTGQLLEVWESSVKATHLFLSEEEIENIKNYVPQAIQEIPYLIIAVNEQNPLAKGFYEYMGFKVYKRTECDEQGNPYPLLYMKLN